MRFFNLVFFFFLAACAHQQIPLLPPLPSAQRTEIQSEILLFQSGKRQQALGGLSDLVFSKAESTPERMYFYAMTDRGPNGNGLRVGKELRREFIFPGFTPQILKIAYEPATGTAKVEARVPLKNKKKNMTGLPSRDETPTANGKVLALDPHGVDSESLALDKDGNFWIGEEYGPDVLKFSPKGELLGRWSPGKGLPAYLADRELNRGFEAATLTSKNTILFILQGEIPAQKNKLAPMVEFDPVHNKTVAVYYYPMDPQGGKIGAATLGENGEIFILEQNGRTGGEAWQKIFALDFHGATRDVESLKAKRGWKIPEEFVPVGKTERINLSLLSPSGLSDLEKLEGMAWTENAGFVIVNDNDFEVVSSIRGTPKIGSFLIFVK